MLRLPSKEVVLREWLRRRAVTPESEFDQVVRNEIELSRAFAGLLQESGVTYHDMLPALVDGLEAAIRRDEPFYRPNDGHPLEFGYQVYADAAIEALRRMHTQQRNR